MPNPSEHLPPWEVVDESRVDAALDAAVRHLLCACFPPDAERFSACRAWNNVAPAFSVVCRQGAEMVGHVGIVDRRIVCGSEPVRIAGIQSLAVAACWRGTGLAQQIMSAAMDEARRRGIRHGLLFCVPSLEALYGRMGWQRVDRPVSMQDAAGRTVPLTAKNIAMELALAGARLAPGTIDLAGRDW